MKLLILGGTSFLGRHLTEVALNRGYQVTLFNRNKTNPGIYPQAEHLVGDRDGGLAVLLNNTWDAVIDVCGYVPRHVGDSAKLLKEQVAHYVFISTLSVYDLTLPQQEITEQSPLVDTKDIDTEEWLDSAYGGLKVKCEQVIEDYYPQQATYLRCGFITGPYALCDRFNYWLDRVDRGGEVLVPQSPTDLFQFIDARDIAEFAFKAIEGKHHGAFNLTGELLTWEKLLMTCQRVSGSDTTFCWIDDAEFISQHLGAPYRPFGSFPYMDCKEFFKVNVEKALSSGLQCRPTLDAISDTLSWQRGRKMSDMECGSMDIVAETEANQQRGEACWMAGISAKHEANLLAQWRERKR